MVGPDRLLLSVLIGCSLVGTRAVASQEGNTAEAALMRALDLEATDKCREAIPLFRQAMGVADPTGALLGLERCYSMVGRPDSLLPLLDSLVERRPADPTLRTVQLRTLATVRDDGRLQKVFGDWVALDRSDPSPYRVYAQILLEIGRARAADTVLRAGVTALGSGDALASEFAQMHAILGEWVTAANAWRTANERLGYLDQAAVFSLMAVPAPVRDSLRVIFAAAPVTLRARRILAGLELKWREPRSAWAALAQVPSDDSAATAWASFAQDADLEEAWLVARDAWVAVSRARPGDKQSALHGARSALRGGDAPGARQLVQGLVGDRDSTVRVPAVVVLIEALGALGDPAQGQRVLQQHATALDVAATKAAQRALAWAWIRTGNLDRASQSLDLVGRDSEEGERVQSWIALYQGDFRTARRTLRRTDETSHDAVVALALLARTRADSAPGVGHALLTLARRDTLSAAREFRSVAGTLRDATPLLLAMSARLFLGGRDTASALTLWDSLVTSYATSPEAAESELEWARVLRTRGDRAGAITHLEHLILTWPQSALLPQARRELDLARGAVPEGKGSVGDGAVGFALLTAFREGPGGPPQEKNASYRRAVYHRSAAS